MEVSRTKTNFAQIMQRYRGTTPYRKEIIPEKNAAERAAEKLSELPGQGARYVYDCKDHYPDASG